MTHPLPTSTLWLTLQDGVRRQYLLDPAVEADPARPELRCDTRVQAAYVLARQGHRPTWLARHLNLPESAAREIGDHVAPQTPRAASVEIPGPRGWTVGT
ncbi:hypothetical protein [Streptacidiphilus sp. EB129]|uniref:hypothetical protein n=1 Tax=Streptacidiphilus sp. EB129 TaxID=3156262 RepID=UPI0035113DFA